METFEVPGVYVVANGAFSTPLLVAGDVTVIVPGGVTGNIATLPTPIVGTENYLVTLSDAEAVEGAVITFEDQDGDWLGPVTYLTDGGSDETVDAGSEDSSFCIGVSKANGDPIEGVQVFIYSEAVANDACIIRGGKTDEEGVAEFDLDPGTYWAEAFLNDKPFSDIIQINVQ